MKKIILFMLCLNTLAFSAEYLYETGTSFLVVEQKHQSNIISLIHHPDASVKMDGSFCYFNKKTNKCDEYPSKSNEIVEILNPVKYSLMVYPMDSRIASPFEIPRNLSHDLMSFLDIYGTVSNKIKNISKE